MANQWAIVGGVVAVLAGGAVALARFAPARVEVGAMAPDFQATELAGGQRVSFKERYRGTVTLVNIWATWCEPCKQEIPAMDSLFRALGPRGFRIAAVSTDVGDAQIVKDFARQYGISFDVLHDPSGEIGRIYQTTGVPESFLIDRDGRIVRIAQYAAPWNSAANRRIVEQLLAASTP